MQQAFIIIKGQARALQIKSIKLEDNGVYAVQFVNSDRIYHYSLRDVVVLTEAKHYSPSDFQVYEDGNIERNIAGIMVFPQDNIIHWRIIYKSGFVKDFLNGNGIEVRENCLTDEKALNVFEYLKAVAGSNPLGKDEDSDGILAKLYNNISFIDRSLAIAPYIHPQEMKVATMCVPDLIYPFGCNASQRKAVTEAFANQLSVIQGPPGTGKTQTILNIIANIIMQGKTVMVVSNNNAATANVKEKLEKYGMGFIVASLGKKDNKELFIHNQPQMPEEVVSWEIDTNDRTRLNSCVRQTLKLLVKVFEEQEQLAKLKLELQSVRLEWEHFKAEQKIETDVLPSVSADASTVMSLWLQIQAKADKTQEDATGFFTGIIESVLWWWKCRKIKKLLHVAKIDKDNLNPIIIELQKLYYQKRLSEVEQGIEDTKHFLETINAQGLLKELTDDSMCLFKDKLFGKYKDMQPLTLQDTKDIKMHAEEFCNRYPVVLSTTYSARTSVPDFVYDYIIMDEASQVSVETGALALTCATNAVIVGDTKQLPNVITEESKVQLNKIYDKYKEKVGKGYDSVDNSFLESVCKVVPDVRQTLLREHYRCHPRIINFCNQKYYGGNLLIMTEDHNEKDVLSVVKTDEGNHAHGHFNQREIDVIQNEVLPNFPEDADIGIIAPYNAQVNGINRKLEDKSATVHKYQGREKDIIIFSAVDNEISEFVDDPNLLNVALSRAKKKFCLVVTGKEQEKSGNITDLIDYIQYNNCSITESKIRSIFDLLYEAYTEQRRKFLEGLKKVSEYDSENLTYALIDKILKEHGEFGNLGVVCHYPLRLLIRDTSAMTDEEQLYASRRGTHLDFLIYSRVTKRPVQAIEVDGRTYHNELSPQFRRDQLKNSILKKYGIPLLRLRTEDSGEDKKITDFLVEAIKNKNIQPLCNNVQSIT